MQLSPATPTPCSKLVLKLIAHSQRSYQQPEIEARANPPKTTTDDKSRCVHLDLCLLFVICFLST